MKYRNVFCAILSAILMWTGCAASFAESAEEKPAAAESADPSGTETRISREDFEEKGLTVGESFLAYPSLKEGAAAEELRKAVNDRILEDGHVREYAARISQLVSGGRLNVSWRGEVLGPVFSFALSAEGAVRSPRPEQVWTGGNIDLRDGHEILPEEIFTDPEAARERMEAYLEEEAAPELSPHLQNSRVTPLPELFRLTERGLIWMYAMDQLSTLSDRAGDVLIPWDAVADQLDTSEDGILSAAGLLGAAGGETDPEACAERIRTWTERGRIPGVPAALGDSVLELTEKWHLLTDPDVYTLGRLFSLEGAEFRGVFILTDFLSEDWDHSVVDGIRMDLGSFAGLTVGRTTREEWRRLLGEAEHTIEFDAERAEAFRTVPGSRDYYTFGGHRLQLHADGEGVLVSVILSGES